jgi:cell division protein FtsW (lipid II flippase)
MDALRVHLLLNYYPAIGIILGTIIFIGAIRFRSLPAQRFALKLVFFFALLTLAVVLTGEIASHAVEPYSPARANAVASHKVIATATFLAVVATGIAALVALIRGRRDPERGKGIYTIFIILAVLSSVLLVTTILRGRQIKWAVAIPGSSPAVLRSIDTEKKIWHA